jgi:tetratricopeptide (TPR) repeat protein
VRFLGADNRERLRDVVVELLLLLAKGTCQEAGLLGQPEKRNEQIQVALSLNNLAERYMDDANGSRAVWLQRADLAKLLGKSEVEKQARAKLNVTQPQTIQDLYLAAFALEQEGQYRGALYFLQDATQRDPQNFPAWLLKGNCHDELRQDADALACFTAAIALRPKSQLPWLHRGRIYLRQFLWVEAKADFDQALDLKADCVDAYINRALALKGLGKYQDAEKDLSNAMELGNFPTRVYFMRADVRKLARNRAGALSDHQEGLRREPSDSQSWIARALARMRIEREAQETLRDYERRIEREAKGALADLDKALELNPRSVAALQNKAHVLAEKLHKTEDALRILNDAVKLNPEFVQARAGRGILLARLGKMAAAREDARESLLLDTRAPNLYQVAGIYALTSKEQPEDRFEAFALLSKALRSGFGWAYVDGDPDLNPIRKTPEFRQLCEAARALHWQSPRPPSAPSKDATKK